jgi:hypothetical protein
MVTEVGECMVMGSDHQLQVGAIHDGQVLWEDLQWHRAPIYIVAEATEDEYRAWMAYQGQPIAFALAKYFYRVSTD